jgi:hypothetical protein
MTNSPWILVAIVLASRKGAAVTKGDCLALPLPVAAAVTNRGDRVIKEINEAILQIFAYYSEVNLLVPTQVHCACAIT